jgi:hypothetical protein
LLISPLGFLDVFMPGVVEAWVSTLSTGHRRAHFYTGQRAKPVQGISMLGLDFANVASLALKHLSPRLFC